MELVVLTRDQYLADIEAAAQRGAEIALASIRRELVAIPEPESERLVGFDVAADILGVKPSTARTYYKHRGLPMHRTGRTPMFFLSEVREWAKTH